MGKPVNTFCGHIITFAQPVIGPTFRLRLCGVCGRGEIAMRLMLGQTQTANDRLRENVRALMDWRRMTQADLAEKLQRSQPWLSKRLTGTTPFQIEDLDALADVFGLSPQELFCQGHGELDRRTPGSDRRSGVDRRRARPFHPKGMPLTEPDREDVA